MATSTNFIEKSIPFLSALVEWERTLPAVAWNDLREEAQQGRVVLFSMDMINGFCHEGALSGPRVKASKNSINAFYGTHLGEWLDGHRNMSTAVVVGNCTDLCVHQLAMHLKLYANAYDLKMRVIVPENAVQTYDMPVEAASAVGALPHDGDVMHLLFLYHMRLNGVEVVREIV